MYSIIGSPRPKSAAPSTVRKWTRHRSLLQLHQVSQNKNRQKQDKQDRHPTEVLHTCSLLSQRECAVVLAIHGVIKQCPLTDGSEVVAAIIFGSELLLDLLQNVLELQHDRKFVLAVVAAEAGADKLADLSVFVGKFHLVGGGALHNGVAPVAVQADAAHQAAAVIVASALRHDGRHLHLLQLTQREHGVVGATGELVLQLLRRQEPGDDLLRRQGAAIEGDEMGADGVKLPMYGGVRHGDHPLVVRELDLEIVADLLFKVCNLPQSPISSQLNFSKPWVLIALTIERY